MRANQGINAYQSNQTRTRGDVADPYQLVKILFENLADNMSRAKGAIEQKKPKLKGHCIGRSMDIINALREGLDHSAGGEISQNLESLYTYCNQCLVQASTKGDLAQLESAISVIQKLKSTWDQLGSQVDAKS